MPPIIKQKQINAMIDYRNIEERSQYVRAYYGPHAPRGTINGLISLFPRFGITD